ncbi:MAG: RNA polymerase sigma factor [Gorillibacterium sp.]|nr:RNA polymerase sigma factor [Gorillibacterium sp.]
MTFEELYQDYADTVYSFLRFKLRDVHLVEDVFQDTFLSAYRELSLNRTPDSPKAWLLTIAHRRMVDRLRQTNVTQLSLTPELINPDHQDFTTTLLLKALLDQLDDASRSVLYSLYVEGLTIRETSEFLRIPEGTVKSRAFTAKAKLKEWMKEVD